MLGPADQVGQFQGQGVFAPADRDRFQLFPETGQLVQEGGGETRIPGQLRLATGPDRQGIAGRQGPLPAARHGLEGAEAVGEQAEVVALKGRQQGGLQFRQLARFDHDAAVAGLSRKPQE